MRGPREGGDDAWCSQHRWGPCSTPAAPRPWTLPVRVRPPWSIVLSVLHVIDASSSGTPSLGKCRPAPGDPTLMISAAGGGRERLWVSCLPWLRFPGFSSHPAPPSESSAPPLCICVFYFILSSIYPPSSTHTHTLAQTSVLQVLQLHNKHLLLLN